MICPTIHCRLWSLLHPRRLPRPSSRQFYVHPTAARLFGRSGRSLRRHRRPLPVAFDVLQVLAVNFNEQNYSHESHMAGWLNG